MQKKNKIVYWVFTLWLALGMVSTGIVQLIRMEEEVAMITGLGYPTYLMTLLGVCKLLGVVAVLLPGFPLVKEWAYAGFFFMMSGAVASHLAVGDPLVESLPPLLLVALTLISWYFRPAGRKISSEASA